MNRRARTGLRSEAQYGTGTPGRNTELQQLYTTCVTIVFARMYSGYVQRLKKHAFYQILSTVGEVREYMKRRSVTVSHL